MKAMEPMRPMEPIKPMASMNCDVWWPSNLGSPSSSGSQISLRYAFFPQARRLLVEEGGVRRTYDSGTHRISGVSQGSGGSLVFSSDEGDVQLSSLKVLG